MLNFGKGSRPPYKFTPYIILLPKDSEVGERKCKYKACEKKLSEEAKVMTNRKERIKDHLIACKYFKEIYEQVWALEILDYSNTKENPRQSKKVRTISLDKVIQFYSDILIIIFNFYFIKNRSRF